jgi:membrane-associated phospholipid phosphatase
MVDGVPWVHLSAERSLARLGLLLEFGLGVLLLGGAALAGLVLVRRPWPNRFDTVGLRLLPADLGAPWAHDVVALGSLPVLLLGVLVVFLVGVRRDWIRAVTCATAPLLAVVIVQEIAKPLVDRHNLVSGGLSYPSGTVAVVTALATALTLIAPRGARALVGSAGAAAAVATSAAVVVLRWHYPTDALGGLAVGMGSVLLVDALARLGGNFRRRHELTRPQPPAGDQSLRSTVMGTRQQGIFPGIDECRQDASLPAR